MVMRTTLNIDDTLLAEAGRLTGLSERTTLPDEKDVAVGGLRAQDVPFRGECVKSLAAAGRRKRPARLRAHGIVMRPLPYVVHERGAPGHPRRKVHSLEKKLDHQAAVVP